MWFPFGYHSIVPKPKMGHTQKGTASEPHTEEVPSLGGR